MKSTQRVAPRMSDAAVQAKTGKAWAEWFRILDAAGAKQAERMKVYWAEQLGRLKGFLEA
jgi:hypothetical protein